MWSDVMYPFSILPVMTEIFFTITTILLVYKYTHTPYIHIYIYTYTYTYINHFPIQPLVIYNFLIFAKIMDIKWYLTIVQICIF